jgi:hypothetical protein
METEQDRLQKLYGEMSDEHLLDLEDDQEDLTDEARLVLTHELRKRGMLREPSAPNDEPMPATFEPERESGFTPGIPGMYPSSAAAMEQALEPAQAAKDGMSNLISFYDGMELSKACTILETGQIDHAKSLLRAKMGLFPMQEVDGEGYASEGATGLVGVFPTSEEADEVKELLSEVGIAATIAQDDETGDWQVTVDPAEQDRAVAAVASGMGLG